MKDEDTILKIKSILMRYFRNDKVVEVWLNHPHPDLGGKTPQQVIDVGNAQTVLDMLEAALAGVTS